MKVEIISVSSELMLGKLINTNAVYLSEKCADLGFACTYQTTVGDDMDCLKEALSIALKRADFIFMSGGLGSTKSELTMKTVAEACNRKTFDDGVIVLENENGVQPGYIVEVNKSILIMLPGMPSQLQCMFENSVIPYLQQKSNSVYVTQKVKICGMSEEEVAVEIRDLLEQQENPVIIPYAKQGEVHLHLTATASDEKKAGKLLKPVVKELKSRFDQKIYSTEMNVTLEKAIVDLLVANNLTISTVESCTGGLIAGRLINVPGVSEVYKVGHITYSNKAKRKMLGVKRSTLDKYGAVSEQVAREMAKGAAAITKADVTVSVTGIAGPDGGSSEKPVGLVYIGCHVKGETTVRKFQLSGDRSTVRENAVANALILLRECVLEYISEVTFGKKK